jgi:hypothetical protein
MICGVAQSKLSAPDAGTAGLDSPYVSLMSERVSWLLRCGLPAALDRTPATILAVALLLLISLIATTGASQEVPSGAPSPQATFQVSSDLVLVDVVALDAKNGLPDNSLKRDDFAIFDNGHPVAIKTFDTGTAARPLALWFLVQCNMRGWEAEGSGLFAGQMSLFATALKDMQDTVAVAHWCDDGQSQLDLLPTSHVEQVATALDQVLTPVSEVKSHDRSGELALQRTLQQIIDTTRSLSPEPVPVVIFLYGDYSAMPKSEADHFVDELLETSAIVCGLRDRRSPRIRSLWIGGEQGAIANYISTQTGGTYLWVTPETYATGLGEILKQLHFRYEIGFKPEALDGKRHKLVVTLAGSAKAQHKGLSLRYRSAYVPIPHGSR